MKAILVSFFNSNNIGDKVLSSKLCEEFESKVQITKCSYEGSFIIDKFKVNEIILRIKIKVYRFMRFLNLPIKTKSSSHSNQFWNTFENTMLSNDLLIIGGGNMIMDLSEYTRGWEQFDKFISIAKSNNKDIFVTSIGIGPFCTIEQESKALESLNKCNYITFRDQKSFEYFNNRYPDKKNIFLSIDPAFLLKKFSVINTKKVIGINIINPKLFNANNFEYKNIVEGYQNLIEQLTKVFDKNIELFITESLDKKALEDVYRVFRNDGNVVNKGLLEIKPLLKLYSSCDFIVGARMHSMIISYSQKVPFIGLAWQDKVVEMFKIINNEECCFNLNEFKEQIPAIISKCKLEISSIAYKDESNFFSKFDEFESIFSKNKEILDLLEFKYAKK